MRDFKKDVSPGARGTMLPCAMAVGCAGGALQNFKEGRRVAVGWESTAGEAVLFQCAERAGRKSMEVLRAARQIVCTGAPG